MKKILIILLIYVYPAISQQIQKYGEFMLGQTIYTILHYIDYRQTLYTTKSGYYELNPILGRKPTKKKINTYFISSYLLNTVIGFLLYRNNKNYYRYYIAVWIGIKSTIVYHNYVTLGFLF